MTGDDLILLLNTLQAEMASKPSSIVKQETKNLEEDMKQRIFKLGLNSFGSGIGDYMSSKWVNKRAAKGLQTDFVDLKYTGELHQSFTNEKKSNKNEYVLGFSDDYNAEKADYQEILQGQKAGSDRMDIFDPSQAELDKITQSVEDALDKLVENVFTQFQ